jgi:hypothetical protein
MKIKIDGQIIKANFGQKVKLKDGRIAELRGELKDGMMVKLEDGSATIIDPLKDILSLVVEEVKKTVIKIVTDWISGLFSKIFK